MNIVYVLSFGGASRGAFAERALAERELLDQILTGQLIEGAEIREFSVQGPYSDPLSHSVVVDAISSNSKILAIKEYRAANPGMSLLGAKEAVESVWDKVDKHQSCGDRFCSVCKMYH